MSIINYPIDFTKHAKYWPEFEKISYLQRRIIVHSILYYSLDNPVISDLKFDDMCKQLVDMQSMSSFKHFRESRYYYVMYDFDGNTGYHLVNRLTKYDKNYLFMIAYNVIKEVDKRSK